MIIADSSKQVPMLGKFPVPVEVIKFAEALVAKKIAALGAAVKVRADSSGRKFITDEGNHILDCNFGQIPDPPGVGPRTGEDARRGRARIIHRDGGPGVDREGRSGDRTAAR